MRGDGEGAPQSQAFGVSIHAPDALSRVTRTTDPLSQTSDRSYDALGRVTLATDALSNAAQTWYDLDGQVTKSVDALGNARTFAYDSLGRVTRTTDPLSNNSDSFYDSAGRRTKSSDPAGAATSFLYDLASRQTKVTDPLSRATSFAYDSFGRLTRTTDPLSNTTDQSYDLWGRVTKTLDAEGNDVQYSYDLKGQLTLTSYEDPIPWDEMGVENRVLVSTEYDGLGRRTRVLNDNSTAVLRWQYDRLGRLTKLQYANNDAETYLYNIAGQRTKLTRPTGELISYLYDARGALTKTTLPGSALQVYSYDAAGRRTHADDPNTDLDWHLDGAGQVTKVVDNTLSKTIIYSFDAAGRRTSLDGPEASDTQAWSFDAVGRVTKITENAADRAEWLYNLAGQRTKLTYGSGSYGMWEYDTAGRLTNLVHKKSAGTVIQSFAYTLDKVGNRTKLTLNGGDYVEYSYDPLYQLTQEHRKTSGAATQYRNDFYYNYISNRTKLVHNDGTSDTTSTYSYNAADQLTREITGTTTTDYSYDANGALTRKSSGGNNYDYLYDARSLITKYDAPGTSNDTTYNWDLLERRVKKDLNGAVTRFLYDHSIGEILAEYDGSATPVLQASYIPTGLDSNVSMTRSGTLYYFHPDAIQSTWNLTLATDESIQNTYAYQAFGSQYGTPTEGATNTRRFTGAEWNTEDSTQTHGVRRYLPVVARWSSRDRLEDVDNVNLYLYVNNSPTHAIDPLGLQLCRKRIPGSPIFVDPDDQSRGRLTGVITVNGSQCGDDATVEVAVKWSALNPVTKVCDPRLNHAFNQSRELVSRASFQCPGEPPKDLSCSINGFTTREPGGCRSFDVIVNCDIPCCNSGACPNVSGSFRFLFFRPGDFDFDDLFNNRAFNLTPSGKRQDLLYVGARWSARITDECCEMVDCDVDVSPWARWAGAP